MAGRVGERRQLPTAVRTLADLGELADVDGGRRPRGRTAQLGVNFVLGARLSTRPLGRGAGSPRRAVLRLAALGALVGVGALWVLAGPLPAAAAVVAEAGVGAAAWVVWRRVHRWLVRHGVWADTAAGWLVWNVVSGAPVGVGPAMHDETSRRAIVAARAKRAAPRHVAVAVVGAVAYLLAGAPAGGGWWLTLVVGWATPLALAVGLWAAVKAVCALDHFRRWVLPLHLALHEVVGYPLEFPTRRYLHVPRGKAAEGDGVIVGLPPTWRFDAPQNARVLDLTCRVLGLSDVTEHWEGKSNHSFLQLRPTKHAPDTAFFHEPVVRELVEKAKPSAPLIGLGIGDAPVAFDLDSQAPHLLLSAGTGGAKSSQIRSLTAQLMHHGALVWVIDLKRHSQPWLRGLPGVRYIREVQDIHDAFIALAKEGDRRNRLFDDVPLGHAGPKLARLVVICEELNATFNKLRRYWRQIKATGDPMLSPAIEGFQDLLFMGRAVKLHVLAVTQMATAKDLGGPEARENFVVRILSRYTPNAWKMLAGDIAYRPASTTPGRVMVCRAGTATETQAVFFTDLQARQWATSGAEAPADALGEDLAASRGVHDPDLQGEHPASLAASTTGTAPALTVIDGHATDEDELRGVTLREASADEGQGVVPLSHHALRWARDNDPEFPQPTGTRTVRGGTASVFDGDRLAWWHRNRPGTKGVRSQPDTKEAQA